LINITGGMDLAIDEVSTISTIIQEAAGDEAEIIFGAVHDSGMKEEVRVTVIATGFDREAAGAFGGAETVVRGSFGARGATPASVQQEISFHPQAPRRDAKVTPLRLPVPPLRTGSESDLEIPTFIRRQMD
ncbi:MAG: cell division protein FtsZ, partial [Gemmatimonadota bacterium]|nr:cell division protein FtsZ [Gemmatimonadota bacterium]MDQ3605822.1 cell division protein FtsZ [Gemmatimonadota bacterium]